MLCLYLFLVLMQLIASANHEFFLSMGGVPTVVNHNGPFLKKRSLDPKAFTNQRPVSDLPFGGGGWGRMTTRY